MKAKFKHYNQAQGFLLPPSLDELIPAKHPVRVLNKIIDKIDISEIESTYKGGGTTSFSPRMLLKVLIYSYMNNIYSSRKIEMMLHDSIHLMWLSGMQKPDHNTINRFRSKRLESSLKKIFSEIVLLFHEAGHLDIKNIYTDGTKIEANANRYTFVWGKRIKTHREKMLSNINELWEYASSISKEEMQDVRPNDCRNITPENISKTIEEIDKAISKKDDVDKKIKSKVKRIKKSYPEQARKCNEIEAVLDGRNSFSKTDTDAVFMRTKDDHMGNGQLKASYNIQISTNNQFIVNYSVHQSAGDTTTYIEHTEGYKSLYSQYPESDTADAGYGSQENYTYAENNNIEAFIKYNYFHKEQTKKWKNDISKSENLFYNQELDCYICPMGQKMKYIGEREVETKTGFKQIVHRYQAQNCKNCPLRSTCHNGKDNRIIDINKDLKRLRDKARNLLMSSQGIEKRKKRPIEPEAVFGNIKQNKGFKRFLLRGKPKVEVEFGLVAIAHNISKAAA